MTARSRTLARAASMALAACVAASALAPTGCSPAPRHDPQAAYSPKALADELAFRVRALRGKKAAAARTKGAETTADLLGARAGDTKKKAEPRTVEDLAAAALEKLGAIPGTPRAEALDGLLRAVREDSTLTDAEKTALADTLNRPAPAP